MKNIFLGLSVILVLANCGTGKYYKMSGNSEPITESLFNDKDRTISEADVQKLLNGTLTLPDSLRIAIYKFGTTNRTILYGGGYYGRNGETQVKAQQKYVDTLAAHLIQSPHVKRINVVPSLMLSAQPTITQLRESAVRLQSDLLLVFAPASFIYQKSKAFKKDEIRAYATTEVLILDVRTGLVPFASLVSKDFMTKKTSEETLAEGHLRAQQGAIVLTLQECGQKIRAFLQNP